MFLHSFRAPSLEELYSEGPHLASYSFEIGNPKLNPERALAKEIGYNLSLHNLEFSVTGYHNGFGNYNFAVNTGVKNNRYPTLFNYQFSGVKARMYGIESEIRLQLKQHFFFDLTAHYVKADIKEVNDLQWAAMPYTPPFTMKSRLSYRNGSTSTGVSYHFSAEQTRIGDFELPSSSYSLVDVYMQHEWMGNKSKRLNGLHIIRLRVDNLLNVSYYNHLSRIKNLATELGISANIMYRYYF
jgi:iron complex outermembrane receptor protein